MDARMVFALAAGMSSPVEEEAESDRRGAIAGFRDASSYGFSPEATGMENAVALQKAVDGGGTVVVSRPGIYKTASTVYLGSNTSLVFGKGVALKKVDEEGAFAQVLINRARSRRRAMRTSRSRACISS